MTERRRSFRRRRSHDQFLAGAGLVAVFGAVLVIGFDAASRGGFRADGDFAQNLGDSRQAADASRSGPP